MAGMILFQQPELRQPHSRKPKMLRSTHSLKTQAEAHPALSELLYQLPSFDTTASHELIFSQAQNEHLSA